VLWAQYALQSGEIDARRDWSFGSKCERNDWDFLSSQLMQKQSDRESGSAKSLGL
jgi:hypothetical protein